MEVGSESFGHRRLEQPVHDGAAQCQNYAKGNRGDTHKSDAHSGNVIWFHVVEIRSAGRTASHLLPHASVKMKWQSDDQSNRKGIRSTENKEHR